MNLLRSFIVKNFPGPTMVGFLVDLGYERISNTVSEKFA